MFAVVLAAGESRRFWPLGSTQHKGLYRAGSGKTILEYSLEGLLKNRQITKTILIVSPRDLAHAKDLFSSKTKLAVLVQEKPTGGGNAILQIKKFIKKGERFFVTSANKINAGELLGKLLDAKSEAVALKSEEKLSDYGTVKLEKNRIIEVIEKPKPNQIKIPVKITSGYVLEEAFFPYLEKYRDNHYSLEIALNDYVKDHVVAGVNVDEFEDTTLKHPWHLLTLNKILQKGLTKKIHPKAEIAKSAEISGSVVIEEGAKILEFVKLVGPIYIGKNTVIGDYTSLRDNCFVGENVVIGSHSEVKNSIIYNGVHAHRNFIGDSIIDEGTKIGAGTITANKRLDRKGVGESDLAALGAIIGKGASLGINVNLMPGVKIGSGAKVFPGVTVFKDVADLETFRG